MEIIKCNQEDWDNFTRKSPDYTIFNDVKFLEIFEGAYDYLLCLKGNDVVAGICCNVENGDVVRLPYQVYSGLLYANMSGLKLYRMNEDRFRAGECVSKYLMDNYGEVTFGNHWNVQDIRPFQWENYHERKNGYYDVDIRYTSILDISNPLDMSGYSKSRRQAVRKGEEYGLITKEIFQIDEFMALYNRTFFAARYFTFK